MEKPLGKMEIEAMIQAAVEQTNTGRKRLGFKDFCRHPDVALPEGFKIPKFSKYVGVGDPHLLDFLLC